MEDAIRDAYNKGLISFQKEDLIVELLKNPKNWNKMSLALCNTKLERLDRLDKMLVYHQIYN